MSGVRCHRFLTLFTDALPAESAMRVLDVLFSEGAKVGSGVQAGGAAAEAWPPCTAWCAQLASTSTSYPQVLFRVALALFKSAEPYLLQTRNAGAAVPGPLA